MDIIIKRPEKVIKFSEQIYEFGITDKYEYETIQGRTKDD